MFGEHCRLRQTRQREIFNSPTENQEAEKTAGKTAAAEKWEGSGIRPRKGVFLLIAVKSIGV